MSVATQAIQGLIDGPVVLCETSTSLRRLVLGKALRAVLDAEASLANRVTISDLNVVNVKFGDREVQIADGLSGFVVDVPHDALVVRAEPPKPREFVGVCLDVAEFSSPAAAARWAGRVWTYEVDPALGVTVGDSVELPGYVWTHARINEGIVVRLNDTDPTPRCGYVKKIKSIVR